MATVYFVRDGTGESATDAGRKVPLSSIANAFPNRKLVWSKDPPPFGDRSPPNPVSPFMHVDVYVESGETADGFTKDGYWYLAGVSPADFTNTISQS